MAEKPSRIIDVQSLENVVPAASSRPLVVTDRPVLTNDPMMKEPGEAESPKPEEAVIGRTAKTIEPDQAEPGPKEQSGESAENAPVLPAKSSDKSDEPIESSDGSEGEATPVSRDPAAQTAAFETEAAAAQAAREAELEQLIASGKYAVPINALQRKRSRMYVALFCVLAVVLALVLLDALLDAKIVTLPLHVPHTHFFS